MAYLALNCDIMAGRGYFGLLKITHLFVYHPLVSYQRIKVNRFETIDMKIEGTVSLTQLLLMKYTISILVSTVVSIVWG